MGAKTKIVKQAAGLLSEALENLRSNKGLEINPKNKQALSDLRNEPEIKGMTPQGYRINELNKFLKKRQKNPEAQVSLVKSAKGQGPTVRTWREVWPGQGYNAKTNPELVKYINTNTRKLVEKLVGDPAEGGLAYDPAVVSKYLYELKRSHRQIKQRIAKHNKGITNPDEKISLGHLNAISKSIHTPVNIFDESLAENVAKGNRYSENQAAMQAVGNFSGAKVSTETDWLKGWQDDFLVWADKVENGGDGLFPQRQDYTSETFDKLRTLTGNQYDDLSQAGKQEAFDVVQDELTDIDRRTQWKPSQQKELQRWGPLSKPDADEAARRVQDNEYAAQQGLTERGYPMGGGERVIMTSPNKPNLIKRPQVQSGANERGLSFSGQ